MLVRVVNKTSMGKEIICVARKSFSQNETHLRSAGARRRHDWVLNTMFAVQGYIPTALINPSVFMFVFAGTCYCFYGELFLYFFVVAHTIKILPAKTVSQESANHCYKDWVVQDCNIRLEWVPSPWNSYGTRINPVTVLLKSAVSSSLKFFYLRCYKSAPTRPRAAS